MTLLIQTITIPVLILINSNGMNRSYPNHLHKNIVYPCIFRVFFSNLLGLMASMHISGHINAIPKAAVATFVRTHPFLIGWVFISLLLSFDLNFHWMCIGQIKPTDNQPHTNRTEQNKRKQTKCVFTLFKHFWPIHIQWWSIDVLSHKWSHT